MLGARKDLLSTRSGGTHGDVIVVVSVGPNMWVRDVCIHVC